MKNKAGTGVIRQNASFMRMLLLYMSLLLLIAGIACVFSYQQKTEELDSQISLILTGLDREYRDISSSFWKLYMPLFEERNITYDTLHSYFTGEDITRSLHSDLTYSLTQMILRDDRAAWIALYSPERDTNYILFGEQRQLVAQPKDFPYLEQLVGRGMKVMGSRELPGFDTVQETFAIAGNVPNTMGSGYILAGYRTSTLRKVCAGYAFLLDSMQYDLVSSGQVVFSSGEENVSRLTLQEVYHGIIRAEDGSRYYARSQTCGDNDTFLIYSARVSEIVLYTTQHLLLILVLVLLLSAVSIGLYLMTLRRITWEVDIIRQGLERISESDMSTPIEGNFVQGGLQNIAEAINDMAVRLDNNINRAHYYELRQKDAELSELQSKFNPHFLYNTLEMLRNRCEHAGNSDVAEMITDFAAIFRGLIGSHTFVPLKEELTTTRRYLRLLEARYRNQVNIRFDFPRGVLCYGIIRNVFQPLIENYFQYGFDTSNEDNEIIISGRLLDETTMLLSVSDNGCGMTEYAIEALRWKLEQPVKNSRESYGLRNLHQRLKLFYGDDCGLRIERNGERGLRVNIIARKMTCEEYEATRQKDQYTE